MKRHENSSYTAPSEYLVYPIRWVILFLFAVYSATNTIHITQYSIIQDAVVKYYGVSSNFVYWTSIIFSASYVPLVVPGTWLIDKIGLRKTTIIGSFGTCLGAWLKVFSVAQDRYWLAFTAQTIIASYQVFVLSLPPRVAAVWFGPDQVSMACGVGVLGYQLGVALGFVLSPMLVHTHSSIDKLGSEFQLLFYIVAGISTVLFIAILLFFKAKPPSPLSAAIEKASVLDFNFFHSTKNLFLNRSYVLHLIAYSISIGIYYAIATVFNEIILAHYPDANEDAGRIGLILVVSGLIGSVSCGYVLDKTRKFKETALVVYVGTIIAMLIFTFTLNCGYISIVYITSGLLGFCMLGYLAIGLELASELTYPEPEVTTSGMLNASVQIFGVALTLLYEWLLGAVGDRWCNVVCSALLAAGAALTVAVRPDLRRQRAECKDEQSISKL